MGRFSEGYAVGEKALVTGGGGFVGANLCKALQDRNYEVVCYDVEHEHEKLLKSWGVDFFHGDVLNLNELLLAASDCDVVFHLAVVCLGVCMSNPHYGFEVNTKGTLNACMTAKASGAFMVYVSSSEVYGRGEVPMCEDQHLRPTTIYGAGKAAGEMIARSFFYTKGLEYLIIRPFNTYGPLMQEHKYAAVIAKFVQALKKGEKPVIYGDGNQTRDWTYVTEAANGIMRCYEKREKLADSHIVNICSGKEHSVLDLLKILENIIFKGKRTIEPIFVPSRPGDVYRMWGDGTRALSILGFKPTISLRDGLERYARWYDIEHGE